MKNNSMSVFVTLGLFIYLFFNNWRVIFKKEKEMP